MDFKDAECLSCYDSTIIFAANSRSKKWYQLTFVKSHSSIVVFLTVTHAHVLHDLLNFVANLFDSICWKEFPYDIECDSKLACQFS